MILFNWTIAIIVVIAMGVQGGTPGERRSGVSPLRIELLSGGQKQGLSDVQMNDAHTRGGKNMAGMRVSQHCGRCGSANHNDRSFLNALTPEKRVELAGHIRENGEVQLFSWDSNKNFMESELGYYQRTYAAGLEARNARYLANGQPERCRTVENLYTSPKSRPEEVILQIGTKDNTVSAELFIVCVREWNNRLMKWSAEHGNPLSVLTIAIHNDESTPHAHIRRVWNSKDKFGYIIPNQNQALKSAGVELPQPNKPEGRYNNRKMAFDAFARELWQEVCLEHGLEIETEPRPNMKHKSKQDYIAGQIQADIAKKEAERDAAIAAAEKATLEATEKLQEAIKRLQIAFPSHKDREEVLEQVERRTGFKKEILTVAKDPEAVLAAVNDAAAVAFDNNRLQRELQLTKKQLHEAKKQLQRAKEDEIYYQEQERQLKHLQYIERAARDLATGKKDLMKCILLPEWYAIEPRYQEIKDAMAYREQQQLQRNQERER